ncbi:MAG TPA: ABC transporter permease [Chloroflexia bacterium]|nr:ABC transporter permease [Chloroflexia bacterium]
MYILDLAVKDLNQILREKRAALFLVLMPLCFMIFFGLIYGGSDNSKNTRLPVGYANLDQAGALSADLWDNLQASDTIQPQKLENIDAQEVSNSVKAKKLAAALIIPAGYSEQVLSGKTVRLTVIADRQTGVGQTAADAIQAANNRILSALQIARINTEAINLLKPFPDATARQSYFETAYKAASDALIKPATTISLEDARVAGNQKEMTASLQLAPGLMIQFSMFGLMTTAMVLVLERKTGTMQRLLTTRIQRWELIAGHTLAMFLVVLIQAAILVLVGQFLYGVDYLREPLATLLIMVFLSLWVASLGLLISAFSRAEEQVSVWSMIAMFFFSVLGGVWFSLEYTGQVFSTIGHLTPAAWAMDGFQNIVLRGLGFESVLLPSAMLMLYSLAFLLIAVWRLKFEQ